MNVEVLLKMCESILEGRTWERMAFDYSKILASAVCLQRLQDKTAT